MKIIGTSKEEINKYFLDYCSILHFICGILSYIIVYTIVSILFTEPANIFLSIIIMLLGSIIWELVENTALIDMKINERQDNVINSLGDSLSVFFGSIIAYFLYILSLLITFFVVGLLFLIYVGCEILTRIIFGRRQRL